MSNYMNRVFAFAKDEGEFVYCFPFSGKVYKGDKLSLFKYIVKDNPSLSEQLKILMSNDLCFFYDPHLKIIRFIPSQETDLKELEKIIVFYFSNYSRNIDQLNKTCRENKISDFILSKNNEQVAIQIAEYLANFTL